MDFLQDEILWYKSMTHLWESYWFVRQLSVLMQVWYVKHGLPQKAWAALKSQAVMKTMSLVAMTTFCTETDKYKIPFSKGQQALNAVWHYLHKTYLPCSSFGYNLMSKMFYLPNRVMGPRTRGGGDDQSMSVPQLISPALLNVSCRASPRAFAFPVPVLMKGHLLGEFKVAATNLAGDVICCMSKDMEYAYGNKRIAKPDDDGLFNWRALFNDINTIPIVCDYIGTVIAGCGNGMHRTTTSPYDLVSFSTAYSMSMDTHVPPLDPSDGRRLYFKLTQALYASWYQKWLTRTLYFDTRTIIWGKSLASPTILTGLGEDKDTTIIPLSKN